MDKLILEKKDLHVTVADLETGTVLCAVFVNEIYNLLLFLLGLLCNLYLTLPA